ncbi:hypothetical protein ACFY5C_33485 [Streptomyces sp. NPDC012935]|uniref:hypothetical protein n=1 Tax=Streptomyces sp. NPDC012935 TaxID=3364857 RepID=UPI0036C8BE86
MSRLAVWIAIAPGPIALGLTITSTPTTVEAGIPSKPTTAPRTTTVAAYPVGYAQPFVQAWLRRSADEASSAQAPLAQWIAPDVEPPEPAADT